MDKLTGVIISGYFNPIHKGHIEYFHQAKLLGDFLFVIVNNDIQRALKGSTPFQDQSERMEIVQNIKPVDLAILSIDKDRSVTKTINFIHQNYGNRYNLLFANGGDQNNEIIPESQICRKLNIKLVDGLGSKVQSSSWLLKNLNNNGAR